MLNVMNLPLLLSRHSHQVVPDCSKLQFLHFFFLSFSSHRLRLLLCRRMSIIVIVFLVAVALSTRIVLVHSLRFIIWFCYVFTYPCSDSFGPLAVLASATFLHYPASTPVAITSFSDCGLLPDYFSSISLLPSAFLVPSSWYYLPFLCYISACSVVSSIVSPILSSLCQLLSLLLACVRVYLSNSRKAWCYYCYCCPALLSFYGSLSGPTYLMLPMCFVFRAQWIALLSFLSSHALYLPISWFHGNSFTLLLVSFQPYVPLLLTLCSTLRE